MLPDARDARRVPRRLPKLAPLVLAAIVGITVAEQVPMVDAWVWCVGLAIALGWFGIDARRSVLLVAAVLAFGLTHSLSREQREGFPLTARLATGEMIEVTGVGVVADAPSATEAGLRFPLELESLQSGGRTWSLRSRVLARWRVPAGAPPAPLTCGDRIAVSGWMEAPSGPRNPGEFDVATWLRRQGVTAELRIGKLQNVQAGAALPVKRMALRVRDALAAAMTDGLIDRPEEASVIKAMVLGTRDTMADAVDEAFLNAGTLHIFSVSGLHVGLVVVILWRGFNLLRLGRRQAAWASIPMVFLYALLTGWPPAAVRSAMMAAVVLLGIGLNRPASFFNSLCLAALLILAGDSHQLFMAGAQLSFAVIGVIALAEPPVSRWMTRWIRPDPFLPTPLWSWRWHWGLAGWGWLARMLSVSLVAAVGSAPLTLWHFQLATPISLVANLVHVPLAGLILATAGASVALCAWWPWGASIFTHANLFFARGCLVTASWFSEVPGGSLLWNPRRLSEPPGSCFITVFDLGNGGAVLIRTPEGKTWMIDTGRPGAFRGVVRPGLSFLAVRRLDGLILSHGDHDHVGAATEAIEKVAPRWLGHPPQDSRSPAMKAAMALAGPVARPLVAGDVIRLDHQATLSVLWPPAEASAPLADDGCLVLRLDCAGRSVVFSNDAGFLAERALLTGAAGREADIWVRGRHASDLSGLDDFVRWLHPSVVVCAGRDGSQALRTEASWRAMVETGGAQVLDQAEIGAVEITIHADGSIECRGFLAPQGG